MEAVNGVIPLTDNYSFSFNKDGHHFLILGANGTTAVWTNTDTATFTDGDEFTVGVEKAPDFQNADNTAIVVITNKRTGQQRKLDISDIQLPE
jgi:hypothetical protein